MTDVADFSKLSQHSSEQFVLTIAVNSVSNKNFLDSNQDEENLSFWEVAVPAICCFVIRLVRTVTAMTIVKQSF